MICVVYDFAFDYKELNAGEKEIKFWARMGGQLD